MYVIGENVEKACLLGDMTAVSVRSKWREWEEMLAEYEPDGSNFFYIFS